MKRLYETTLGRLELEFEPTDDSVSAWLFDEDGRVAREIRNEYPAAVVADVLETDIGLPRGEADSIGLHFSEASSTGEQTHTGTSPLVGVLVSTILLSVLVTLGVGVWTIATRMSVDRLGVVASVSLTLAVIWILPAILVLRWRDRRREKRQRGAW